MRSALGWLILLCSILISIEYSLITLHNFTNDEDHTSFRFDLIKTWSEFV